MPKGAPSDAATPYSTTEPAAFAPVATPPEAFAPELEAFAPIATPPIALGPPTADPVCVAVGTLLLVVDAHAGLMNPLRFFYLVSNLGSRSQARSGS